MNLNDGRNLYHILKSGILIVFSIIFITLMGGAMVPMVNNFIVDMLIWLTLCVFVMVVYVRAELRHLRREAIEGVRAPGILIALDEISYDLLGLMGGGFFGVLFTSLVKGEYDKAGSFSANVLLLATLGVLGLGFCLASFLKLMRLLRETADRLG